MSRSTSALVVIGCWNGEFTNDIPEANGEAVRHYARPLNSNLASYPSTKFKLFPRPITHLQSGSYFYKRACQLLTLRCSLLHSLPRYVLLLACPRVFRCWGYFMSLILSSCCLSSLSSDRHVLFLEWCFGLIHVWPLHFLAGLELFEKGFPMYSKGVFAWRHVCPIGF